MAGCGIYFHVDVWEWERIFGTGLIEVSEVDAYPLLTIFLLNIDDVGKPVEVMYLTD